MGPENWRGEDYRQFEARGGSTLTNWGRWGPEDQKGALNLLTPEVVLKAVRLVKKGIVYSLAVPLEKDGPQYPLLHKTWKVSHSLFVNEAGSITEDVVIMDAHSGTHIDALGHIWADGRFYNGFPQSGFNSLGLQKAGIENVTWMVGRGVMLDIPAYRKVDHMAPAEIVTGEELDDIGAAQGIKIEQGDIVLIRTGWYKVFYQDRALWESAVPGPDGTLAPWIKQKDICALGADQSSVEARKNILTKPTPSFLHRYALRDLGVYLLENLDLEELARDKVYEFLFVGAPLRLMYASGTPWNPLAMI